jgi:alkylhydroperoxidase family enzyme
MAWIKTVQPEEATGELAELYMQLQRHGRPIGNVVRAYSVKPALMRAARDFSHAVTFGGSSLGRRKEELIATAVAAKLRCTY